MRLTGSVAYAVGVLLQIQRSELDVPITAARIAQGCRFPPRFLYRILRRLVDAGLLRGTSGPGGGYQLARAAQQISLWDIVSGVEQSPTASVLQPACAKQRPAIAHINDLCRESGERFAASLRRCSLADLAADMRHKPASSVTRGVKRSATRVS